MVVQVQHQRDLVTVTRARGPTISEGREEDMVDDDEVGKRQLTALLAQIEGLEARCQVRHRPTEAQSSVPAQWRSACWWCHHLTAPGSAPLCLASLSRRSRASRLPRRRRRGPRSSTTGRRWQTCDKRCR